MKLFGRSKTPTKLDSAKAAPLSTDRFEHLRIQKITIHNYKAIDDLAITFPKPEILSDPDITVIGSRNGVGKSSILECCAMVSAAFMTRYPDELEKAKYVVKYGCSEFEIEADIELEGQRSRVKIKVPVHGTSEVDVRPNLKKENLTNSSYHTDLRGDEFLTVLHKEPDPVILPCLLFFHSYRRTPDIQLEQHGLFSDYVSWFKKICLRNILESRRILDSDVQEGSEEEVLVLNQLLNEFADADLGQVKLDVADDGSLDYNIYTNKGARLRFESLSSGQRDIISTLYLIWFLTRGSQSVVLIDEPELHLNSEWHQKYISNLNTLAPNNQYILATHSPDVAAAVMPERRVILGGT